MNSDSQIKITGFLKIFDPESQQVFVDKTNAIHFENISEALAYSLSNKKSHFVYEMHFGKGGTSFDTTGVINYLPTNTNVQNADLYNPTFFKIVDGGDEDNRDPLRNNMNVEICPDSDLWPKDNEILEAVFMLDLCNVDEKEEWDEWCETNFN